MMIGPAPMTRIEEMSVRLGIYDDFAIGANKALPVGEGGFPAGEVVG